MIIIPAIDIMGGKVVRLQKGDPTRSTIYGDSPSEFALKWESEGADMLHIVDLDATLSLGSNSAIIEQMSSQSSIPLEIAGGLRSVDTALKAASRNNRIVLGTMALTDTDSLFSLRDKLGSSRIVVSLDHRSGIIAVKGWTEQTEMGLAETLDSLISQGISEFMITDVERDGMKSGPELDMLEDACKRKANVIASGGVSSIDDIAKIEKCGAYGAILGRAIYDNALSIKEAKAVCL